VTAVVFFKKKIVSRRSALCRLTACCEQHKRKVRLWLKKYLSVVKVHLQFLHQELSALIYERKDRDVMRI
jgi:hypothetical protein